MSTQARAVAEIDLSAVAASVAMLKRTVGSAEVMTVVKADAYGHGMLPCAQQALRSGATWLGTAFLAEAIALRSAGITAPVLAMISVPGEDVGPAIEAGIDLPVGTQRGLDAIAAAARSRGTTARVHLKVDTGLTRGGATAAEWSELVQSAAKLQAEESIEVVGIWSHLACADEPGHPSTDTALELFDDALAVAEVQGITPQVRHVASSGAVLATPQSHYDLVRPGLATYGLSPFGTAVEGLEPAMTLRSMVIQTKRVPAGTGVSYGLRYATTADSTMALVPVGYADGIPRTASNRGPLQVAGRVRTVAGTVCMDQVVVDCGDDPVSEGEEVVVFGKGGPSAEDWARACNTISYEIVTRIGARVPRVYVGGSA